MLVKDIPVVEDGRLIGIIAEKGVLHRLFPSLDELMEGMAAIDLDKMMNQYKDVLNLDVRDVMTRNPLTVSPDMHVLRAATVMVRHEFRRIPVADGDMLSAWGMCIRRYFTPTYRKSYPLVDRSRTEKNRVPDRCRTVLSPQSPGNTAIEKACGEGYSAGCGNRCAVRSFE